MMNGDFAAVQRVADREELRAQSVSFARQLGFDTVAATVVVNRADEGFDFVGIDNTPPPYRALFDDPARGRRYPVAQHCRRSGTPIQWDQAIYVAAGEPELWEEQARFGYRHAISLALRLPLGRHVFIGVDRDQSFPDDAAQVAGIAARLYLFASFAQDAALRVLTSASIHGDIPKLTPGELECLRWSMEGRTAWELGNILNINEQTAARHLKCAAQRLGCVNKVQAVVKALRLGLIQ